MENCIYVFYNKLSGRFEGVFSFPTDAVCKARLSKKGAFDREELEIKKVGTYSVLDGMIKPTAPVLLDIPQSDDTLPVSEAK